jgi:hypothetical protein
VPLALPDALWEVANAYHAEAQRRIRPIPVELSANRKLSTNGLLGSAQSGSKMRAKVNSLSPNPQLLIALHSPNKLREAGLRMCPPEKSRDSDSVLCEQSVLCSPVC